MMNKKNRLCCLLMISFVGFLPTYSQFNRKKLEQDSNVLVAELKSQYASYAIAKLDSQGRLKAQEGMLAICWQLLGLNIVMGKHMKVDYYYIKQMHSTLFPMLQNELRKMQKASFLEEEKKAIELKIQQYELNKVYIQMMLRKIGYQYYTTGEQLPQVPELYKKFHVLYNFIGRSFEENPYSKNLNIARVFYDYFLFLNDRAENEFEQNVGYLYLFLKKSEESLFRKPAIIAADDYAQELFPLVRTVVEESGIDTVKIGEFSQPESDGYRLLQSVTPAQFSIFNIEIGTGEAVKIDDPIQQYNPFLHTPFVKKFLLIRHLFKLAEGYILLGTLLKDSPQKGERQLALSAITKGLRFIEANYKDYPVGGSVDLLSYYYFRSQLIDFCNQKSREVLQLFEQPLNRIIDEVDQLKDEDVRYLQKDIIPKLNEWVNTVYEKHQGQNERENRQFRRLAVCIHHQLATINRQLKLNVDLVSYAYKSQLEIEKRKKKKKEKAFKREEQAKEERKQSLRKLQEKKKKKDKDEREQIRKKHEEKRAQKERKIKEAKSKVIKKRKTQREKKQRENQRKIKSDRQLRHKMEEEIETLKRKYEKQREERQRRRKLEKEQNDSQPNQEEHMSSGLKEQNHDSDEERIDKDNSMDSLLSNSSDSDKESMGQDNGANTNREEIYEDTMEEVSDDSGKDNIKQGNGMNELVPNREKSDKHTMKQEQGSNVNELLSSSDDSGKDNIGQGNGMNELLPNREEIYEDTMEEVSDVNELLSSNNHSDEKTMGQGHRIDYVIANDRNGGSMGQDSDRNELPSNNNYDKVGSHQYGQASGFSASNDSIDEQLFVPESKNDLSEVSNKEDGNTFQNDGELMNNAPINMLPTNNKEHSNTKENTGDAGDGSQDIIKVIGALGVLAIVAVPGAKYLGKKGFLSLQTKKQVASDSEKQA